MRILVFYCFLVAVLAIPAEIVVSNGQAIADTASVPSHLIIYNNGGL